MATDTNGLNGAEGRTPGGTFARGNRYSVGRGNPIHRRMHDLRKEMLEAVEPEKVREVILKMGELATAGDAVAARLFLEFAVGRPIQAVEVSGPDGEALDGWRRAQAKIIAALAPFPEARIAVARALMEGADDEP